MPSRPCAAAILAGGRARRLNGADKTQLVVGGRTILARQLDVLRQLTSSILFIGATPPAGSGTDDLTAIADAEPGLGPLAGIQAALAHAAAPCTVIVACDMPFLSLGFLAHLVERVEDADAAVPRTGAGYHPLCAAYHHSVLPEVTARLTRRALAVRDLLGAVRVEPIGPDTIARFDPEGLLLTNVNTPQDYEWACARAARR